MGRRARGLRTQRWFCVAGQIKAIGNCSLLIGRSLRLPTFPALERRCRRIVARRCSGGLGDNFTAVLVFADFPWRRVTQLVVPLPSFAYLSDPTFNHCSFNSCTRRSFLLRPPLHCLTQLIRCILYVVCIRLWVHLGRRPKTVFGKSGPSVDTKTLCFAPRQKNKYICPDPIKLATLRRYHKP